MPCSLLYGTLMGRLQEGVFDNVLPQSAAPLHTVAYCCFAAINAIVCVSSS